MMNTKRESAPPACSGLTSWAASNRIGAIPEAMTTTMRLIELFDFRAICIAAMQMALKSNNSINLIVVDEID